MAAAGIGAGVGAVSEANQQAAGYFMAREASDQAWKRQKRVLQNRIQWQVADMKAAGINPILAAQGAFGGGAPSVAQTQIPQSNVSRGASAGAEAALKGAQVGQTKASANALTSDAQLKTTQAVTEGVRQLQIEAQANQNYAQEELLRAQTKIVEAGQSQADSSKELYDYTPTRRALQIQELFPKMTIPLPKPR